jgi:hypothetical protein
MRRSRGTTAGAIVLALAGFLIVVLSFAEWGSCSSTPCGGPLFAISEYTGIDLGFGRLSAFAGIGLVGIGIHRLLRSHARRFDWLAAVLAVVVITSAGASVLWMYVLPSDTADPDSFWGGFTAPLSDAVLVSKDFYWPPYTPMVVGLVGLLALAAALWLGRSGPSPGVDMSIAST